jgi:hypothetical protein
VPISAETLPAGGGDGGNPPPVFLNHFFAVLDTPTYKAIEADQFWRTEFAPNERRTTVRTDETYTGLYFYGANTYFELFDVADSPRPAVIGDCGVAFGVEVGGDIALLKEKLGDELETSTQPITRLYRGEQVPWFYMATLRSLPYELPTTTWLMEYHPEFLKRWNTEAGGDHGRGGVRRRDILARYAAVLAPVREPVLHDVVGLTVAVDGPTRDRFVEFCGGVGYAVRGGDGGSVSLEGPDFALRFIVAANHGVREVRMRTGPAPLASREQQFGRAVFTAADGHATLSIR